MSNLRWQDLLGNYDGSKEASSVEADDESTSLNFESLAAVASNKEGSDGEADFYHETLGPAPRSVFAAFLNEADLTDEYGFEPDEADLQAAQEAIDNDDEVIYDVAAETGQIVGNVKHMDWFVQAVAEALHDQNTTPLTEACMVASGKKKAKTAAGEASAPAPELNVGDSVIAYPTGSTFPGTITAINGDQITIERDVNGKTFTKPFPRSIVKPAAAVEEHKQQRHQEDEAEEAEKARVVDEEAAKFKQELVKQLTQSQATGTYDQLANYLMSAGYKLKLDVSDDQVESFANQYQELAGEELNATSRPKDPKHSQKGGWTLEFDDTPQVRKFLPWPIDVEKTGLTPRSGEGNERATTSAETSTFSSTTSQENLLRR